MQEMRISNLGGEDTGNNSSDKVNSHGPEGAAAVGRIHKSDPGTVILNVNHTRMEEIPAGTEHAAPKVVKRAHSTKILRFARSERILHWCIAGPFLVSMASALILVAIYNPDPSRPYRSFFSGLHRTSGVALMILPMLAAFKARGDARLHLYNIRQAWIWMFDDFKWLALMGLAAVNSKIKLPEQGKFNAAEKINFMVLMVTYPLYVATGLLMWLTPLAILSWLLHFFMALMAVPLISGHLFMAVINPASRVGLHGMISGFVDRQWAKHHYRRWYRDHHEAHEVHEVHEVHESHEVRAPDETGESPCSSAGLARDACEPAVLVHPRIAAGGASN